MKHRESYGLVVCDKRRNLSDIKTDFGPRVDFTSIETEEDTWWEVNKELGTFILLLSLNLHISDLIFNILHINIVTLLLLIILKRGTLGNESQPILQLPTNPAVYKNRCSFAPRIPPRFFESSSLESEFEC